MTCAALGLEEEAVQDYITQNKPTYPQFETWVKENSKSLNKETVKDIMPRCAVIFTTMRHAEPLLGAC